MTEKQYDIYTAGPLFDEKEIRRCGIIEEAFKGLDFFSPRLETKEYGMKLGQCNYSIKTGDMTPYETLDDVLIARDEAATKILEANINAIENSRAVIACIDNRDPGTMFEIGYAVCLGKPVITYSFENYGSNVMISQSTVYHATITEDNVSELTDAVFQLLSEYNGDNQEARQKLFKLKDMVIE